MSCIDVVIMQKTLNSISLPSYNPDIPNDFTQGISMYNLSCKYQNYTKQHYHLLYHSKYSDIHVDDVNALIIKRYRKGTTTRETYIGFFHINRLRYIIPNFVYTINYTSSHILLEYIPGDTLSDLEYISTESTIECLAQLLLALEIAQREIGFTHFDLHYDNIILRPIDSPYTYIVIIDNIEYTVVCEDFIPTIIDYGYSSCWIGKDFIGDNNMKKDGILPHLVPGVDIYKLLYFLLYFSLQQHLNKLENILIDIFLEFYGDTDPYLIISQDKSINRMNLKRCAKEYGRKVIDSPAAYRTPLELFNLLQSKNLVTSVSLNPRNHYKILQRGIPNKQISILKIPNSYITQNYINHLTQHPLIPFIKDGNIDAKIFQRFKTNWTYIYNYYTNTISNTDFINPIKINKDVYTFVKLFSRFKNIITLYYTYKELVYTKVIDPIIQFDVYEIYTCLYQSISIAISKYIRYIDVMCTHQYKKKYNNILSILHR